MAAVVQVEAAEPDKARNTKKAAGSVPAYQEANHLRSISLTRSGIRLQLPVRTKQCESLGLGPGFFTVAGNPK